VLFLTEAGKQARGSARCGGRRQRRPASERAELFCSSPPTSASCCLVVQQTVCSTRAKRLRVSNLLITQLLTNFVTHLTYLTQISSFRYCGLFNVSEHNFYYVEMKNLNYIKTANMNILKLNNTATATCFGLMRYMKATYRGKTCCSNYGI
jgi:hypothetical protein